MILKRGKKIDWEERLEDSKVPWEREDILKEWKDNWTLRSADTKKMSFEQFAEYQIEGKKIDEYWSKTEKSKSELLSFVRCNLDKYTDYIKYLKENNLEDELELLFGNSKT